MFLRKVGHAPRANPLRWSVGGGDPLTLMVLCDPGSLWLRLFWLGGSSWDVLGARERKERVRSARICTREDRGVTDAFRPDP